MLDEKLYTVADVAQVTGLTSRTIRNYLKDGTLTGQKIGVQWRFTEDEIKKLFSRQSPGQRSPSQIVRGFLGEQDRARAEACVLFDFPDISELEGMELYQKMQEICCGEVGSMSYEYHEESRLLRVALSGDAEAVMDLLDQMKARMKRA